jgi:saccharopine dehydrogenase (NADP+, L-glutamate forming)
VAPDSDNNPWHYKISWNPRNVVLAGKAGAKFRDTTGYVINSRRVKTNYAKPETGFPGNEVRKVKYEELFNDCKEVTIAGLGKLAYYPNRNSLSYISLYGLDEIQTFVRTTLRYPEFCKGWKYVVAWKLTEEEPQYYTQDLPIALFFKQHFEKHHIAEEVKEKLESDALLKEQFNYLGLNDFSTCINKGLCSAADILQFILETKLALQPQDQDMIIMLHEIIYQQEEKLSGVNSLLIAKGNDSLHTAMAKAVGLPLGIAAKLLLEGGIKETGLQIPVIPTIYESVLKELSYQGIEFKEYAVPFPQ